MKIAKWVVAMAEKGIVRECFQFENEETARRECEEIKRRMDEEENDLAVREIAESAKIVMVVARSGKIEDVREYESAEEIAADAKRMAFDERTDHAKLFPIE